jgi:hypothetical protein
LARRIKEWLMSKDKPETEPVEADAPMPPPMAEPEPMPKPKPISARGLAEIQKELGEVLKRLAAAQSSDPYLADAQAFLTQAVACLGKQITAEGGSGGAKPTP